jgi:hypothetical protein
MMAATPGLLHAEAEDGFALSWGGPPPYLSTYGHRWAGDGQVADDAEAATTEAKAWETEALTWLATLSPLEDLALRDALSRWWEQGLEATSAGFAQAGIVVGPVTP